MRTLVLISLSFLLLSSVLRADLDHAKADAKTKHRLILLIFSGSDWCIHCMKMNEDVFSKDTFHRFADAHLEVVTADFPRLKKNRQDAAVIRQNEALADQYNKDGHFPFVLLLDADGAVLKTWDGYHGENAETVIQQIRPYVGSH